MIAVVLWHRRATLYRQLEVPPLLLIALIEGSEHICCRYIGRPQEFKVWAIIRSSRCLSRFATAVLNFA